MKNGEKCEIKMDSRFRGNDGSLGLSLHFNRLERPHNQVPSAGGRGELGGMV